MTTLSRLTPAHLHALRLVKAKHHLQAQRPRIRIEPAIEDDWRSWLRTLFPAYVSDLDGVPIPFADHHAAFWEWVWAIRKGVRTRPFIAIWPRGGAKSTSAEMACVALGARRARNYGLYICETQEQADDHVGTVGMMLESAGIEQHYPELASRLMGKFGNSRGWRRNRLRTAAGFTLDAIGLDSAARGVKLEEDRPDFLVFDDIDGELDTALTVDKKIATITRRLLPAGAQDVAILGVQNLVHPDGVFARLADGRADFLAERIVSGPHPAVEGLTYEERGGRAFITGGAPTWAGMDVPRCQQFVDDWGLTAFLVEAQHQVTLLRESIFDAAWWANGRNRYGAVPKHVERVVFRFLSFDTAMKDDEAADYTACGVYELFADYRVAVREVWWEKLQFPALRQRIEEEAVRWDYDGRLKAVVVEDKSSGTSAIQDLRASSPTWLAELIAAFEPKGSKEYRAREVSVWCQRDCVLLPQPTEDAAWLPRFEHLLYRFPAERVKDPVDQFTQILLYLEHHFRHNRGIGGILSAGWQTRQRAAEQLAAVAAAEQEAA